MFVEVLLDIVLLGDIESLFDVVLLGGVEVLLHVVFMSDTAASHDKSHSMPLNTASMHTAISLSQLLSKVQTKVL